MLTVDGLRYTYPGANAPALHELSFSVATGEIFGFLGPSGAGKSTTQRILIGLLRDFEGSVEVMGKGLKQWGSEYYENVGVSFELPNHYQKLTALENLRLFAGLYKRHTQDPMSLLEQVGLKEDANTRVAAFSKGMQMRLNFVRALLHAPPLLFLDEPTSGLDPGNARTVKDMILERKSAGTTIFLTTHDMTVASELCDRVAFINDGRLACVESPRALRMQFGRRMLRVEYGENGSRSIEEFPLQNLGTNPEFLRLLQNEPIQTMHTEEATLEEIFLTVTGRQLQ